MSIVIYNTNIPFYGICIFISIILGIIVISKNLSILIFSKEDKMAFLVYLIFGIVLGAKYYTYLTNINMYKKFNFFKMGLSSYGALIGIFISSFAFSKVYNKSYKDLISIIIPSIPLMYSIGKIGCFIAGCCYGIPYSGPFNVVYNYSNGIIEGKSLFPIQLLEAVVFILIYIYISKLNERKYIISKTIILCSIFKFLLDFLRMSHINKILTLNQIISIIFLLIGIYLEYTQYIRIKKQKI